MVINVEIYNKHIRQVKSFELTTELLEKQIKLYPYQGEHNKVDSITEDIKLPPFALPFYSLVYNLGNVPSQETFIEEYFKSPYFKCIDDNTVIYDVDNAPITLDKAAVIARLLRTYPSLIRDLHFLLLAQESNLFSSVKYSFTDDYKNCIDIKVCFKNNWYNIGLLLGSKRAIFYKLKKQFRHKPTEIIYIELYPKEACQCGDYLLYTRQHIRQLYYQIVKIEKL